MVELLLLPITPIRKYIIYMYDRAIRLHRQTLVV